jgi:hypothetical protein
LIEESLRLIRVQQVKMKEEIKRLEQEEKQLKTRIVKFNKALEDEDDTNVIKVLAKQIGDTEEKQAKNFDALAKTKIESEQLNEKYSNTEMANVYYNVKERILEFFKKMNIEEQRDCLIRTIKECLIFTPYLLIDTGIVLFVFDTRKTYHFKDAILKNLDKDTIYKKYFIESLTETKRFLDIQDLEKTAILKQKMFDVNETVIFDCKLNGRNKHFNLSIAQQLFKKNKINYDFSNHATILFFFEDYLE